MDFNSNSQAYFGSLGQADIRNYARMHERARWHDRLREALRGKGWTKADLARASGVSYDNINKYWRGEIENPRGDTFEKLAGALGVPLRWLMGFDDPAGAPFFVGEPSDDPGPLDLASSTAALRLVLGRLTGEAGLRNIPEARLRQMAHQLSDTYRAIARQGWTLDRAFMLTIAAFLRNSDKRYDQDAIDRAARSAARAYEAVLPLSDIREAG
ncbi:MAG: helix-turn-helix domain-containing protein [Amphiplicatus sp.]